MRSRSQGRGTLLRVQQPVKTPGPPSTLGSMPSPVTSGGKGNTRLPMIASSPSPAAPSSLFSSLYDDSPIGPSLLSQPHTLTQSRSGSGSGTRTNTNAGSVNHAVGVCSQQGRRPYQEDEFSIRPFLSKSSLHGESPSHTHSASPTHFFGLFDGHAGGRCSQHLASQLAQTLVEDSLFESDLPAALKRSFHTTNEQFLRFAEKNKLHDGSTGLCVVVRDNRITVANVGDCRAVLVSMGGNARAPTVQVTQLSNDHKPTSVDEQKRILSLGGCVVNCMGVARVNRVLAVSRAFGNRTLRTVIRPDAELTQREIGPQDEFLIMASDGLWDVLRNKEVGDVCAAVLFSPTQLSLSHTQRAQRVAEELVSLALQRGSMDNVTCIAVALSTDLFRCTSSALPSSSTAVFAGEKGRERAASTSASTPRNITLSSVSMSSNVHGNSSTTAASSTEEVRQFRRQMEQTLQGSTLGNSAANTLGSGVNGNNLYGSLHNYGNLQGSYVNSNSAVLEGESERAFLSSSLPPRSALNGPPPVTRTPSTPSLTHVDRPLTVDNDRGRGGAILSNPMPSRPMSQSGRAVSTQRERERERERERLRARDF